MTVRKIANRISRLAHNPPRIYAVLDVLNFAENNNQRVNSQFDLKINNILRTFGHYGG